MARKNTFDLLKKLPRQEFPRGLLVDLLEKVENLNVEAAKRDAQVFLSKTSQATNSWSKDLFRSLANRFLFV